MNNLFLTVYKYTFYNLAHKRYFYINSNHIIMYLDIEYPHESPYLTCFYDELKLSMIYVHGKTF